MKTAITVFALLLGTLVGAVSPAPGLAAEQGLIRLDVTIGKSQVIDLKEPFTRVSVTNPNIADVFAITPNQILVNGKAAGTTSLVAFYPGKTLFFDLVVQADLGLLGERLKQVAPKDDIVGQPAMVLAGAMPRSIHHQGRLLEQAMVGSLVVIGIIFGLAMLYFVERFILSRVTGLGAEIAQLGQGSRSRVTALTGRDEVSALSRAINRMLDELDAARANYVMATRAASSMPRGGAVK